MAASVLVDASFLVTLLNAREFNNAWAEAEARRLSTTLENMRARFGSIPFAGASSLRSSQ
jgi:hypothetical protein